MEDCVVGVRNGGGLGSSYVAYGSIGDKSRDPSTRLLTLGGVLVGVAGEEEENNFEVLLAVILEDCKQ